MKWYRYVLRYGILYVGTFSDNYLHTELLSTWMVNALLVPIREFENKKILQGYILKKVPSPTSGEGTYWLIVFGGGVCVWRKNIIRRMYNRGRKRKKRIDKRENWSQMVN
jgi:hypothetical protein